MFLLRPRCNELLIRLQIIASIRKEVNNAKQAWNFAKNGRKNLNLREVTDDFLNSAII